MIILDTSVMIDHLRDHPDAVSRLDETFASGVRVGASVISRVELLRGMRSHERRATSDLIGALHWISVTPAIADGAGTLARRYRASHSSIDPMDFIVAATTMATGARLWTMNVRHFPMFDGLEPPY